VLEGQLVEQESAFEDRLAGSGERQHRPVLGLVNGHVQHHQVGDLTQPRGEIIQEALILAFGDVRYAGDDGAHVSS
jgi:hypothetical protein